MGLGMRPKKTAAISLSAAAVLTSVTACGEAAVAAPAPVVLHVATTGSDINPGTAGAPLKTVAQAAKMVGPGTTVLIHGGYYNGQVKVKVSGTASAPITFKPAGDGAVILDSAQTPAACDSSQPAVQRTVMISADYVTVTGLRINNGVTVVGDNQNNAYKWHANLVNQGIWEPRRAIAGRGVNDPAAARANLVSDLNAVTGSVVNPADGVQVTGNTITGRGIYAGMARYGTYRDNTIRSIACGTGPGIWLITFSDGNTVNGNDITGVMASGYKHYMQEGIRFGTASNYNTVTGNYVHDLGDGDARGITTDVDSSFNTLTGNAVVAAATGFSEQMSGWGNIWRNNYASGYRNYGYGVRLMDGNYTTPQWTSASRGGTWDCNIATSPGTATAKALGVGGIADGTFTRNGFNTVWLSKAVRAYWTAEGNTWNGSSAAPATAPSTTGACGDVAERLAGVAGRALGR